MSVKESSKSFLDLLSKNSKKIMIILGTLALLCAITGGGIWYYWNLNKDTLAIVGGEKITTTDLNNLVYGRNFGGTPDKPEMQLSEQERLDAIDGLVENKIIEIKAKDLGLVATEEEILSNVSKSLESEAGKNDGDTFYNSYTDTQKELTRENARINVLKDKVKGKELGWLSGKYLLVRFDKYNANIPESVRAAVPKESDRASLTEKQRLEAETYAKTLAQRLNSGEDFETVRLSLSTHPVLGYPGVSPQTPVMNGEIEKNDYLEGLFTEVNQFQSFNDEAVKVTKGQSAILPIIKTDAGDDLEFYVIYAASDKASGYMYGYQNWLSKQKEQLLQKNKVAKLIEANTAKALAFTNDICGMSGYGHAHCFVLRTYYYSKSGTETSINDYNFVLSAPGAADGKGLRLNGVSKDSIQMSSTSNGIVFYSYGKGTWQDYWNDYINCNETNEFKITFNENDGDDVSIPGSIQSLGYWDNYINTSADSSVLTNSGIGSAHNNDSLYATICLDNSSCDGVGVTGWANGQSTTFSYRWYPHWNSAPVASYVSPDNDTSYTLPNAGATMTVHDLVVESSDVDGDQTAHRVEYRKTFNVDGTVATGNDARWHSFGCSASSSPDDVGALWYYSSCSTANSFGMTNMGWTGNLDGSVNYMTVGTHDGFPGGVVGADLILGAGTYEWAVQAMDEHSTASGVYSPWVTGRKFTVINPITAGLPTCDLDASPTTINGGGSSKLTWTTTRADSVLAYANGVAATWAGSPAALNNGTGVTVTPAATTTYTMSAKSTAGTTNCPSATVQVVTPSLTCAVTPTSGETPLAVKVKLTTGGGVDGPYDYAMNFDNLADQLIQLNKSSSTFWYTYSNAGTYRIKARTNSSSPNRFNGGAWVDCPPVSPTTPGGTVTVTDPTDSTGGEVRP